MSKFTFFENIFTGNNAFDNLDFLKKCYEYKMINFNKILNNNIYEKYTLGEKKFLYSNSQNLEFYQTLYNLGKINLLKEVGNTHNSITLSINNTTILDFKFLHSTNYELSKWLYGLGKINLNAKIINNAQGESDLITLLEHKFCYYDKNLHYYKWLYSIGTINLEKNSGYYYNGVNISILDWKFSSSKDYETLLWFYNIGKVNLNKNLTDNFTILEYVFSNATDYKTCKWLHSLDKINLNKCKENDNLTLLERKFLNSGNYEFSFWLYSLGPIDFNKVDLVKIFNNCRCTNFNIKKNNYYLSILENAFINSTDIELSKWLYTLETIKLYKLSTDTLTILENAFINSSNTELSNWLYNLGTINLNKTNEEISILEELILNTDINLNSITEKEIDYKLNISSQNIKTIYEKTKDTPLWNWILKNLNITKEIKSFLILYKIIDFDTKKYISDIKDLVKTKDFNQTEIILDLLLIVENLSNRLDNIDGNSKNNFYFYKS